MDAPRRLAVLSLLNQSRLRDNPLFIKDIYNLNEPFTDSSRYIGMITRAKIDEEEIDHLPEFTD